MKASRVVLTAVSSLLLTACGGGSNEPVETISLDCSIPTDELFAVTARDAIPSLTNPEVVVGSVASFMFDDDRVLGVVVNGEPRAYPFGILWWHEIVNDTLGGENILVTYCPLTGSGIAFDPHVGGLLRNFAVSGLLFRTNLTMVDREKESLWNQMLLGSQCGVDRGAVLTRIPIVETDWVTWKTNHPSTTVVTQNTGVARPYFDYPYGNYADPNNNLVDFLPSGVTWSNQLKTKELVLGVFVGSTAVAYPLAAMAAQGGAVAANDDVASLPVVVTYRSAGNVAVAFDRRVSGQTLTFNVTGSTPFTMVDVETGSEWNGVGEATSGPMSGQRLQQVDDAYVAFWFAWSIYYPNIQIFQF